MLPILIRDLRHQLNDAGIVEAAADWDLAFTWDGHGLFDDEQCVEQGFRFDAYVEVFRRTEEDRKVFHAARRWPHVGPAPKPQLRHMREGLEPQPTSFPRGENHRVDHHP